MLGGIVGDIIGSCREGRKSVFNEHGEITALIKNGVSTPCATPEPILHQGLTFTDDSVLMVATDKALRMGPFRNAPFAEHYAGFFEIHSQQGTELYRGPGIGFGSMFLEWADAYLNGENPRPYGSAGNGAAMRVAAVAYRFDALLEVLNQAKLSADCTHNHPDGVHGAQLTAMAIWAARQGASAPDILALLRANSRWDFEYDEALLIRQYVFNPLAAASVPVALWAALQGPDFDGVMRRCLKIGGDTDTICAIAGAVSEPLWGLPASMAVMAEQILQQDGPFLWGEYQRFAEQYPPNLVGVKPTPPTVSSWWGRLRAVLLRHQTT